jgi:hypothetical protein
MKTINSRVIYVICAAGAAMMVGTGCSHNVQAATGYTPVPPRYPVGTPNLDPSQKATVEAGIVSVQADNTIPPGVKSQELATMRAELGRAPSTNSRPPAFNGSGN